MTEKMTFVVLSSVLLRAMISWCICTMIHKEKNKKWRLLETGLRRFRFIWGKHVDWEDNYFNTLKIINCFLSFKYHSFNQINYFPLLKFFQSPLIPAPHLSDFEQFPTHLYLRPESTCCLLDPEITIFLMLVIDEEKLFFSFLS